MKTILKKSIALFLLFITFSCSKDSATTPCIPVTCLNGGISKPDCGCNCPQGFTGANCGTQITPTKILVTKIRITKFPNLKTDGSYWDALAVSPYTRPDIFPVLFDSTGTNVIYYGTPTKQDVFSYGNDQFDFIPASPIQITNPTSSFNLYLFDEDTSTSQELMGGFYLSLYNSTAGFPTTLYYGQSTDSVNFQLTVSYVW